VLSFFEQRAAKCEQLGPLRAVIYQDKHPDLAEKRDRAEKELLLPKLQLGKDDRVLDVGCGTGRWASLLIPSCARYRGVDVSPGLIAIATKLHGQHANARFSVGSLEELSRAGLGETDGFTRIVCFGVLVYLNDGEARRAMRAMLECAATRCRFVLREPVGIPGRLTIKEHFSEDMDQIYNAIYRTEEELMAMIAPTFLAAGFEVLERGDLYADADLNNRTETRQRFFVLVR
jgi:cyclopropane fatty-acyl-phospholipid synthase-like methyltransferase